jgi:hypothetical protein
MAKVSFRKMHANVDANRPEQEGERIPAGFMTSEGVPRCLDDWMVPILLPVEEPICME